MQKKSSELLVGLFVIIAILAFIFLAFKVSGLSFQNIGGEKTYVVTADFTDIGSLNENAAVRIAGVKVGQVTDISLDGDSFEAKVTIKINQKFNDIPTDSSASIQTMGILGDSYIALQPGYDNAVLKDHGHIQTTYAATNLNSLISTFASGGKTK
jgi:phospholipid/cholesterol/gamma-HCH transport system substrate-binding protein